MRKHLQEFLVKPYNLDDKSLYIKIYAESIDDILAKAERGDIIIPTGNFIIYDEEKIVVVK